MVVMSKKKDMQVERRAKKVVLLFTGSLLALVVVVYAFMKICFPTYASTISIDYYITLAGILPVLLVALFLSQPNRIPRRKNKLFWQSMLEEGKAESLIGFAVGEIACLLAIATGYSATLLLTASIFGVVVIIMVTFRRIVYGGAE